MELSCHPHLNNFQSLGRWSSCQNALFALFAFPARRAREMSSFCAFCSTCARAQQKERERERVVFESRFGKILCCRPKGISRTRRLTHARTADLRVAEATGQTLTIASNFQAIAVIANEGTRNSLRRQVEPSSSLTSVATAEAVC